MRFFEYSSSSNKNTSDDEYIKYRRRRDYYYGPYPPSNSGNSNIYSSDYNYGDGGSDEAWVLCLSMMICIMLLMMLAFTASYPLSYYYSSSNYNGYHTASPAVHGCPECWL